MCNNSFICSRSYYLPHIHYNYTIELMFIQSTNEIESTLSTNAENEFIQLNKFLNKKIESNMKHRSEYMETANISFKYYIYRIRVSL